MRTTGNPSTLSSATEIDHNPNFNMLDGLRAVAALGVFGYHLDHTVQLPYSLHLILSHGNGGVPLFFVLSGFLLYRPLAIKRSIGRPVRAISFYKRRAVRILPAYWLALSILAIWPGLPKFDSRWWQFYLLGQGFDPSTVFAGIGPAWSLAIEATFYLALPVYAIALGARISVRAEILVLTSLSLCSIAFHEWIGRTAFEELGYTLPGTFYLFAAGMSIAVIHARTKLIDRTAELIRAPSLLWAGAATAFVAVTATIPADDLGSVHPVYGLLSILIFLPAIMPGKMAEILLASKPFSALGIVSYAFYLWHQDIIRQAAQVSTNWMCVAGLAFGSTVVVATLSYWIVERPILRVARPRLS